MELNKKNMQQLMILISFGIGLFWILSNLELVLGFLSHFIHLLLPFIIGAIIAFILNIPMAKIESFIKGKLKNYFITSFLSYFYLINLLFINTRIN